MLHKILLGLLVVASVSMIARRKEMVDLKSIA
jgi:hypothetical protein